MITMVNDKNIDPIHFLKAEIVSDRCGVWCVELFLKLIAAMKFNFQL